MHPELFTIPWLNISVKSYGAMMVTGFLLALWLARWRAKKMGEHPDHISNIGLGLLLLGVIGARLFHVVHHWDNYRDNPMEMFAVWSGGLEFLGGFILAIVGFGLYCRIKKLPLFKLLDILIPSLMLGLGIGRLGCFLNGCCYGAVCTLPWAVQFPPVNTLSDFQIGSETQYSYRYSPPYERQLTPDFDRDADAQALIELPDGFYDGYSDGQGWSPSLALISPDKKFYAYPKPPGDLTDAQRQRLRDDFPMQAIHPAQIYSTLNALLICVILNLAFTRYKFQGQIIALGLILYGPSRFFLESLRADNPIEFTGFTVSQNLGILTAVIGVVLLVVLSRKKHMQVQA